jgi:TonB family protein
VPEALAVEPADDAQTAPVQRRLARRASERRPAAFAVATPIAADGVPVPSAPVADPPPSAPEAPIAAETAIVPLPRLAGPSPGEPSPRELPAAISAGEASYLRTYETFPSLPRSLWISGRTYHVLVEVCVTDGGRVADVLVRSGAAPELDRTLVSAVRSWRYRPRIVAGAARPFCHLMKMEYSLRG